VEHRKHLLRGLLTVLIVVTSFCAVAAVDYAVLTHPRILAFWIAKIAQTQLNAHVLLSSAHFNPSGSLTLQRLRLVMPAHPDFSLLVDKADVFFDPTALKVRHIYVRLSQLSLTVGRNWSTPFDDLLKKGKSKTGKRREIPSVRLQLSGVEVRLEPLDGLVLQIDRGEVFLCKSGGTLCVSVKADVRDAGRICGEVQVEDERIFGVVRFESADVARLLTHLPERYLVEPLTAIKAGRIRLDATFRLRNSRFTSRFAAQIHSALFAIPKTKLTVAGINATLTGTYDGERFNAFCFGKGRVETGGEASFAVILAGDERLHAHVDAWAVGVEINKRLRQGLPKAAEAVFDAINPRGKADCHFTLHYDQKPVFRLEFLCRSETSVEAKWFPYRVTNLSGGAVFDGKSVSFSASSLLPCGRIDATGKFNLEEDSFYVRVEGSGIEVDGRTKAALPESVASVIERLGATGKVPFAVDVRKVKGRDVEWSVEVGLGGLHLKPGDFPVDVRLDAGSLTVRERGVVFSGISGTVAGGRVEVDDFTLPYGSDEFMVRCDIVGVKVEKKLLGMLLEMVGLEKADWSAEGVADVELRFVRKGEEVRYEGEARLRGMGLLYRAFPVEMRDARGLIRFGEWGAEVVALEGKAGGGEAAVWGEVSERDGRWMSRLRIEAYGVVVDERLRKALPDFARYYFDLFKPRGQADFACHLDGPTNDLGCTLALTLRHCAVSVPHFPYPLSDVSGRVVVDVGTGSVVLERIVSRDGAIVVDGVSAPRGKKRLTRLSVKLRGLQIDDDLLAALPSGDVLSDLRLSGRVSGCVDLTITQNAQTSITYSAVLYPQNCSINAGVEFDNISGSVVLSGHYGRKSHLAPIRLDLKGVTVYGFQIERVVCAMEVGEEGVKFSGLDGSVYGGRLRGSVSVGKDGVDLKVSVSKASVRRAAEHLFGTKMRKVTGDVSASFTGRLSKKSFSGKGRIRLRHANIWQVPFFSELVRVLSLGAVKGVPFDKAGAKFELKNDRIRFPNAYFYSAVIGLKGRGSLTYSGRLRFKFAIKIAPGVMKYLPLVNWVIDLIKNNIVEILVRGTAKRPTIILAPFQPLADFFRSDE